MSLRTLWFSVAISLASGPALAAGPTKAQCAESYKKGQVQRRDGELKAAAKSFAACAEAACPAALRKDCAPWQKQVQASMPSIVVRVKGAAQPTVRLDDEPVTTSGAIELDPGTHVVRAEADGFEPAEQTVKIRAGEHDIAVDLVLVPKQKPAPPPPIVPPTRPIGGPTIAFAALGVVSLGAFGYFGLRGMGRKSDLEACRPACDPARVDEVRRDYLLANVSAGVGALFLGIATYTFLTRPTATPSAPAVGLTVLPGGGALTLDGQF